MARRPGPLRALAATRWHDRHLWRNLGGESDCHSQPHTELQELLRLLDATGLRPHVDRQVPISQAREAFAAMQSGSLVGKAVLTVGDTGAPDPNVPSHPTPREPIAPH
ncbi:zinc-binding dehydrogenase [Nocardioides endophyticus]|uniref:zinc-binding dehydrogenase n=1 Tax=Nocardioides endophyticus TaxID=1353775 RepID=UPI003CD05E51